MDGTGKVGGIRRCSQVVNHVACGHNAQSGVEQYGGMENGFVKSLLVFAMTPAHIDEVAPELAFFDETRGADIAEEEGVKEGQEPR